MTVIGWVPMPPKVRPIRKSFQTVVIMQDQDDDEDVAATSAG